MNIAVALFGFIAGIFAWVEAGKRAVIEQELDKRTQQVFYLQSLLKESQAARAELLNKLAGSEDE